MDVVTESSCLGSDRQVDYMLNKYRANHIFLHIYGNQEGLISPFSLFLPLSIVEYPGLCAEWYATIFS